MEEKIILKQKTYEDLTKEDIMGKTIPAIVTGGVYSIVSNDEEFTRPYIALPENEAEYISTSNMRKFVRITSAQYSFWDIPVVIDNGYVSFASTNEVRSFGLKDLKEKVNDTYSAWLRPSHRIHTMILDLIVRIVYRDLTLTKESYEKLINDICKYSKAVEMLRICTYKKVHNTSGVPYLKNGGEPYVFDTEIPTLPFFTTTKGIIVPKNIPEPVVPEAKEEELVEEVPVKEEVVEPIVEEKEEESPIEETTEPETEGPEKELVGEKKKDRRAPRSRGPIPVDIAKRLPKQGITVDTLTDDELKCFISAFDAYAGKTLLAAMGMKETSYKALRVKYEKCQFELERRIRAGEIEPQGEEEAVKTSGFDTICKDSEIVEYISIPDIKLYLDTKNAKPSLSGDAKRFSLSGMRLFCEMDTSNDSSIQATYDLRSKSNVIRLRGKILNELGRRGEDADSGINHPTNYFVIKDLRYLSMKGANFLVDITDVGVKLFATDLAKFTVKTIMAEYNLDIDAFNHMLTFCLGKINDLIK